MLDVSMLGEEEPAHRARGFACELFAAGVDWIQLRDRNVEADGLFSAATALVAAADEVGRGLVLVNRRVDVALAARAHGVHLGFDAPNAREARRLLGRDALIGRSLHSADEVAASADEPDVDYAHLAPIWNPLSKPASKPALGPEILAKAAQSSDLPLLAQGGIEGEYPSVAIASGAVGVAVTGTICAAAQPAAAVAVLRGSLDRSAPAE